MTSIRDEFLSEEDLDLRNLTEEELVAYWNQWLEQAQATNDVDASTYSHGVFMGFEARSGTPESTPGTPRKEPERLFLLD